MPCCVAINCNNRSEKGWRLFRFPADNVRRTKWISNVRRGTNWMPSAGSRLCEMHFEDLQFEQARKDGWKKLKPCAIPTLFDIPKPPGTVDPLLPRKSLNKNRNRNVSSATSLKMGHAVAEVKNLINETDANRLLLQECEIIALENEANTIMRLKRENRQLRRAYERLQADQVKMNKALIIENQQLRKQLAAIDATNNLKNEEYEYEELEI